MKGESLTDVAFSLEKKRRRDEEVKETEEGGTEGE